MSHETVHKLESDRYAYLVHRRFVREEQKGTDNVPDTVGDEHHRTNRGLLGEARYVRRDKRHREGNARGEGDGNEDTEQLSALVINSVDKNGADEPGICQQGPLQVA